MRKPILFVLAAAVLAAVATLPAIAADDAAPAMPAVGQNAPTFTLPSQDGSPISLKSLHGKWVVLYFYPRADTPGCTTQACGVRDHSADYASANAVVLGVSPDPVGKIKKFHDKHSLGFPLLADEDHAVAESYGVWVEKSMYGRTYWGNERTTFVIDRDGRIARVLRKVKPAAHDKRIRSPARTPATFGASRTAFSRV